MDGGISITSPRLRGKPARICEAHLEKVNSPKWDYDDATFERTASSFDNPDYVSIVIHNYRWRLNLAEGDPC